MPGGQSAGSEFEVRIPARERITVPAGSFDAFRIEQRGWSQFPKGVVHLAIRAWRAPAEVRNFIAREEIRRVGNQVVFAELSELVWYKQS